MENKENEFMAKFEIECSHDLPYAEYDPESDAVYVCLRKEKVQRSVDLDDSRIIDYSADGAVVGIEFLGVGRSKEE